MIYSDICFNLCATVFHIFCKKKTFSEVKVLFLLSTAVLFSLFSKVDGIRHGNEVDPPKNYSFMVHGGNCAAVLLSPNVAIGSAHCCYTNLVIGAHDISKFDEDVEIFEVTESLFQPGFKVGTNQNDLVLLRLNGFSKHRPIKLKEKYNYYTEELKDKIDLLLIGWGATEYGGYL